MRVALVHDYLREFGGAERVLKTLSEIYPGAPIYTAFRVRGSTADKEFKGKKIVESFLAPILKIDNLYSPLRFLAPVIWKSLNLSNYDLVITSSSWYITRGFRIGPKTKVICYCHTPPRWLYGYETSVGLTKYWPVKVYATIVGHFMRMYDYASAQEPKQISNFQSPISKAHSGVDFFIANSKNVQERIKKFYRRDSTVIYPPVEVEEIIKATQNLKKENYFLIVSRLVGAKGIEHAVKAFRDKSLSKHKLKIVGEGVGFKNYDLRFKNIEFLGRVSDEKLYELYGRAKGFIALAKDEDFGMTVVEAQAAGIPVIAYNGGGFKESVVDGTTGILINNTAEKTITDAIEKLSKMKWRKEQLQENARKFSKERFKVEIRKFVKNYA